MGIGITRDEYDDEQREWELLVEEAFAAGYCACHDDVEDYDHDLLTMRNLRYKEWINGDS